MANGNFSNGGRDTFDAAKRYIGIRLQQGVPLLDRDWNELEDIRRHYEWTLRENFVGEVCRVLPVMRYGRLRQLHRRSTVRKGDGSQRRIADWGEVNIGGGIFT